MSSHARNGGAERYLESLLARLDPTSVVEVICLEDGPLAERLAAAGHRVRVIPTGPSPVAIARSALSLRRTLLRSRPDVIHANNVKAALAAVLAVPGTRLPVVWVKHDVAWDGWLARSVAFRAAQVVAVSQAVTRTFGNGVRRKVHVVHNGLPPVDVDRGEARARLRAALGAPEETPVAVLVGRMDPVKGHLELVEATPALVRARPDLIVAFVGGDDASNPGHGDRVRERAAELGVGSTIRFLGHRDDAQVLIAGADVAAIPSVATAWGGREGFPLVGLEAMAVGTPVVAYAHGGVPEQLGPCGVLVTPGDREGLARAILRVVEDAALAERLSGCGIDRSATLFSIDRMVEATVERYREAAGYRR